MARDTTFIPPPTTTELCAAAKQFIVSNHAVTIAEMESKHMMELNQLKVGSKTDPHPSSSRPQKPHQFRLTMS